MGTDQRSYSSWIETLIDYCDSLLRKQAPQGDKVALAPGTQPPTAASPTTK